MTNKAIKYFNDGYFDSENVFRWKSNNSVPPQEILHELHESALLTTRQFLVSFSTQEKEMMEFLQEYQERKTLSGPSDEDLFEMQAAFGTDITVVDIITGQRITL